MLTTGGFITSEKSEQYVAEAAAYSEAWPGHYLGAVLIWEGKAYAWRYSVGDAQDERPGVIAIDADGHVFIAEDEMNAMARNAGHCCQKMVNKCSCTGLIKDYLCITFVIL